ncbi:hypothetical protein [Sphaerimonospora mesophila]|uniref:hypothetical protein n=1 Tax=Sphaerimonospora mesophila TaxID=37483 RepID=UPI000A83E48D
MTTASPGDPTRTAAVRLPTQWVGERIWSLVEPTGDAGAPRDDLLRNIFCTVNQLERGKGYIRDFTAMARGKAFLATRSVYLISTDANRCSEYIGWRLRTVDRELRRMLSGTIDPLGDLVVQHDVLNYYREEILRMLQVVEGMRERGFPVSIMPNGGGVPVP